jgi:hypothetical protein
MKEGLAIEQLCIIYDSERGFEYLKILPVKTENM